MGLDGARRVVGERSEEFRLIGADDVFFVGI